MEPRVNAAPMPATRRRRVSKLFMTILLPENDKARIDERGDSVKGRAVAP
jgi:hypothetical protein